ncbi:MAG: DUF5110 domain-containing protein [Phycisphaerae bacterium]|nr:DUF5110 domain-containing protein [Phycisphaerae bacterium]
MNQSWSLAAAMVVLAAVSGRSSLAESNTARQTGEVTQIAKGVWKIRFAEPEPFVPTAFQQRPPMIEEINALPEPGKPPFAPADVCFRRASGRLVVYVPCDEPGHQIYGFGLDPGAYEQKGLRKYLTVSAQTWDKTGASHGPVPFYVSTKGYGLYVDTARVPFVHVARLAPKVAARASGEKGKRIETSEAALYAARKAAGRPEVVFDVPAAQGADVYVFGGPTIRQAVQRYTLFSGGGCVPPMWGLGLKYRAYTKADHNAVMKVAEALRQFKIPCDMLGLEPGWQTKAYSCSLVWSDERFPNHQAFTDKLVGMGYRMNLWEHAYIHPTSPLFDPLRDRSGDYLVWGGLVVDFVDPEASRTFADYHDTTFVQKGIAGFKLDECDRQTISDTTPFNYPYVTAFPSGIDGDQMTQLYGYLYQRSLYSVFRKHNRRTWGDVRATTALAAPLPFNLYSDAYGFDQYLRQLVNASFAGLLWSPEVRNAGSFAELINRVAMSAYAPQMCLNLWFMPNPIWMHYDRANNEAGKFLPEAEQHRVADTLRKIVNQRMSLLPYYYAAFHRYRTEGLPPTRALVLEYPDDRNMRSVDNAFMFGDNLLVAPFMGQDCSRKVHFPRGDNWIDLQTNTRYAGGEKHAFKGTPGDVPVFVKEGTLLPLAEPVEYVASDTVFNVTVRVYGDAPPPFTLYEDDGETFDFEKGALNRVTLSWKDGRVAVERAGNYAGRQYRIAQWEKVGIRAPEDANQRATPGDPAKRSDMRRISDGATYTTSSVFEPQPGDGKLLDPNETGEPFAFHTLEENGAHVLIDLKSTKNVTGVVIVNRQDDRDEIVERAASLAVWVSNDGTQWDRIWQAPSAQAEWRFLLKEPTKARYVKIGLQAKSFLHLKRVFLYGP